MSKIIHCHPDWQVELLKDTVKTSVEAFLGGLRKKKKFTFIGKPTIIGEDGHDIFTITSGEQFKGKFRIIDGPAGNFLEIENEESSKDAKELLWDDIYETLESIFSKSFDQVQSK